MKTKTVKVKDLGPRRGMASGDRMRLADGRWGEVTQNYPTKGGPHFQEGQGHFVQWAEGGTLSGGFFCGEDSAVVEVMR